jgi:hypothetical protein
MPRAQPIHAESTFGTEFMERERAEARASRERDVVPWLRALGIRADDARKAATHCESIPDASLEERVRLALRYCGPRGTTYVAAPAT